MSRRDFFQLFCMFYLQCINRKCAKEKKHQHLTLYQNWSRTPVYFKLAVSASYTFVCAEKNINLRDLIESLAAQLLVVPSHYQVGWIWENHLLVSHNPSSQADAPWITNSLQRRNFTADLIAPPLPPLLHNPSILKFAQIVCCQIPLFYEPLWIRGWGGLFCIQCLLESLKCFYCSARPHGRNTDAPILMP